MSLLWPRWELPSSIFVAVPLVKYLHQCILHNVYLKLWLKPRYFKKEIILSKSRNIGYFQVRYDSRVVIYDRRGFIRLATGMMQPAPPQKLPSPIGPYFCHRQYLHVVTSSRYLFEDVAWAEASFEEFFCFTKMALNKILFFWFLVPKEQVQVQKHQFSPIIIQLKIVKSGLWKKNRKLGKFKLMLMGDLVLSR